MRIFIVGTNYSPELTGTGRYTGEMGAWLVSRGHDVTVIASPPHYPAWKVASTYRGRWFHTEVVAGAKVHRTPTYVPAPDKANGLRRIAMESSFTLSSAVWWSRYLLASQLPDVIIAICPPTQTIFWPWVMKALRGVPVLFHVQDLQLDAAAQLDMLASRRLLSLLASVERWALQSATHVSTISTKMRERIISKGIDGSRVSILPNWSSISPELDPGRVKEARRRLGARDDQLLALYSGNLGRKQGLDVLIDAVYLLRNRSDVHVVIIGGGADEGRLRARAQSLGLPDALFRPLVPEAELPAALAAADVHLVIQRAEAADLVMPSKLTNILAAGRPAIATAQTGTEVGQVISGHDVGILAEPGDPSALAAAVERVASDRGLLANMGINASKYASENLDKEVLLGRLEDLISVLLLNSRPNRNAGPGGVQ